MSPPECVRGKAGQWPGNLEKQVWWPRGGSGWALWMPRHLVSLPSAQELRAVPGDAVLECRKPRLLCGCAAWASRWRGCGGGGMETQQGERGNPESPAWQSQGRRRSCRRGRKQECRGHGRREGGRTGGYLQRHPLLPRAQVRCPLPTITSDRAEEVRRVGGTSGTVQLLSRRQIVKMEFNRHWLSPSWASFICPPNKIEGSWRE